MVTRTLVASKWQLSLTMLLVDALYLRVPVDFNERITLREGGFFKLSQKIAFYNFLRQISKNYAT